MPRGRRRDVDGKRLILDALKRRESHGATSDWLRKTTKLSKSAVFGNLNNLTKSEEVSKEINYAGETVYIFSDYLEGVKLYQRSPYHSILRFFLHCPSINWKFDSGFFEWSLKKRNTTKPRVFLPLDPHIIQIRLGLDNESVLGYVKQLQNNGLIRKVQAIEHKPHSELYDLTKHGLVSAIKAATLAGDEINWQEVAFNYRHLFPSFLGKWPQFIENGAEEIAIETVRRAVEQPVIWDPQQNMGAPMIAIHRLTSEFVFPTPLYDQDKVFFTEKSITRGEAWLRSVTTDNELLELASKLAWQRHRKYDQLSKRWTHISKLLRNRVTDPSMEITQSQLIDSNSDSPETALAELLLKMYNKLDSQRHQILSFWLEMSVI